MSKYNYSESEQQRNSVLINQAKELGEIHFSKEEAIENTILSSEKVLRSLGYNYAEMKDEPKKEEIKTIIVPTWEKLLMEAEKSVGKVNELEDLFTQQELKSNEEAIRMLNQEYSNLNRLDKYDVGIAAVAGIVGALTDILLVGIPQKGKTGLSAGRLSDYVRKRFDDKFPEEEMEKLANSKRSKVSFDAQDNRNTKTYVEGMSAYYHRLLSLGHDPLLGFVVGVFDIITGRMTTIDKSGKLVSQVMENYATRKENDIFSALAKQILHFKSDITTSMGLPAPLMSLFSFFQFGSVGDEEQTIAEIVQGMYYEGYDFVHFCSQSIPVMIIEIVIRLGYSVKHIKAGYSLKESIPISTSKNKKPELTTMLFIGHSIASAANAGKILFTKNPMTINYPQWLTFVRYSYLEIKKVLIDNPKAREAYVQGLLNEEFKDINKLSEVLFQELSKEYVFKFES